MRNRADRPARGSGAMHCTTRPRQLALPGTCRPAAERCSGACCAACVGDVPAACRSQGPSPPADSAGPSCRHDDTPPSARASGPARRIVIATAQPWLDAVAAILLSRSIRSCCSAGPRRLSSRSMSSSSSRAGRTVRPSSTRSSSAMTSHSCSPSSRAARCTTSPFGSGCSASVASSVLRPDPGPPRMRSAPSRAGWNSARTRSLALPCSPMPSSSASAPPLEPSGRAEETPCAGSASSGIASSWSLLTRSGSGAAQIARAVVLPSAARVQSRAL